MSKLAPIAKAIYAGLVAGLAALGGYLTNSTSFGQITAGQWVFIATSVLVAFGGTYGLTNRTPPAA
jgi:hypothetical protein